MAWDIRRNGTESIGGSVLPEVSLSRGSTAGRTGVVPHAGSLGFTTDASRVTVGDTIQVLRENTVRWSGRVRDVQQTYDRETNQIRWQVQASGFIADLVAIEASAETREYRNILLHTAIGHLLDAIGWPQARRDIGTSTRRIAYWRLRSDVAPWEELLKLWRTAGPRARLWEDNQGRIAFRDVDLPALSRTIYGRLRGSGARAILSQLPSDDAGLDRIVNQIAIPYATTPTVPAIGQTASRWGTIDLSSHNASAELLESEIGEDEVAVAFAGYGAFIDGALDIGDEGVPQWNSLYDESWVRTFGSTSGGSLTATATTAVSQVTGGGFAIGASHNHIGWTTDGPPGTPPQAGQTTDWINTGGGAFTRDASTHSGQSERFTQGGAGSVTVAIPVGATGISVAVTSITQREVGTRRAAGGLKTAFREINTLNAGSASSHFTVIRNGNVITVTPRAAQGTQTVNIPPGGSNSVSQYVVGLRVSYTVGSTARTWSVLHVGVPTGKLETATNIPTPGGITVRTAANVALLRFSNASTPRVVSAGVRVSSGAMLVSACVVEGRLNASISASPPSGWSLVSGAPSIAAGADANNSRRILFVATRRMAAGGTVPSATWSASGPSDARVRTIIVALEASRETVWKDPLAERTISGAVNIDVRDDAPLVNLVTPIQGFDYSLEAGSISAVSLIEGLAGISVRIAITGAGATISGLRLRGNKVIVDDVVTASSAASIASYTRSSIAPKFADYIAQAEAQALANAIIAYSRLPRAAWQVQLDGARDGQTLAAALAADIRQRIGVDIDSAFDREGEVLGLRHELREPANLLRTTITMLAATGTGPASAPDSPAAPTLRALSSTSVSATVTAPNDNGSPITRYEWQHRRSGTSTWTSATSTTPALTITGLTASTAYQVRVRAVNIIGTSAYSQSASVTTPAAGEAPGAPASVAVTPGDGRLVVTWAAGTGGAPTAYRVWYKSGGSSTVISGAAEVSPRPTGTSATITGLTNGTEYAVWVAAINAEGQSSVTGPVTGTPAADVVITVPATPAVPTLVAGNAQIEATWVAPNNGGAAISDYDVQYKVGSVSTWTTWPHTGTALTATITGLTNGTAYDVRVRAINSAGPSQWSAAASATPSASVLDPPTGVSVAAIGDNTATISWTAVAAATGYRVEWGDDTNYDIGFWQGIGASGSFSMRSLTAGTDYYVRIRSLDATRTSVWVNRTFTTTGGTTSAPDAPAAPTLTAGDAEIGVAWVAPDDGGAAITDYDVQYRAGVSGAWSSWTHSGTGLSATITGLTNGTSYQVQVRATNSVGSSAWSTAASATPAAIAQPPGVPRSVSLVVGDGQLLLRWDAPNTGDAQTGYDIRWSAGAQEIGNTTAAAGDLNFTIDNLTNGTEYTVQIRATNAAGNSAYVTVRGTPVLAVPGVPRNLAASGNDDRLSVTWDAPATGGEVRDYRIEWAAGTTPVGNHTLAGTSYTITSLTAGTEYTIRVRAQNTAGNSAYVTVRATPTDTTLRFDSTQDDVAITAGVPFVAVVLPEAAGGVTPLTYALTPALPSGLTFTAATRTISGIATEGLAETTYTLTVTDSTTPTAETATLTFALTVAAANVRGKPTLAWNWGLTSGTTIWRGVRTSYTVPAGYTLSGNQPYRYRHRRGTGSWTEIRSGLQAQTIRFSTADDTPFEVEVSLLVANSTDSLDVGWTEWSDTLDVTTAPSSSEDSPIPVYFTLDSAPIMIDDRPTRTIEPHEEDDNADS